MNKLRKLNKYQIILLVFFVAFFLAITFLFLISQGKELPPGLTPTPSQKEQPTNTGKFGTLVAGKDTPESVQIKLGNPSSTTVAGNKLYFLYNTIYPDFQDIVMFENEKLIYAKKNIIENFEKPENYNQRLGQPDLTLFDKKDEVIEWRIYSGSGIALGVAPFENIVVKIIYFIPQNKDSFVKKLSEELGLIREKEIHVEEFIDLESESAL